METNKTVRGWDTKTFWGCEFADGLISLRSVARKERWAAATWTADGTPGEDPGFAGYELSLYNAHDGTWVRRLAGLTRAEVLALGKAWVAVK
jgi:hypothetical protein